MEETLNIILQELKAIKSQNEILNTRLQEIENRPVTTTPPPPPQRTISKTDKELNSLNNFQRRLAKDSPVLAKYFLSQLQKSNQ